MEKYLVVTKVEEGTPAGADTATPGRKSQKITFKEVSTRVVVVNGQQKEVKTNSPERVRNIWDKFIDDEGKVFKGDALFNDLAVGDIVAGSIESHEVEEYEIPGSDRVATRYSAVVFDNEDVKSYFEKQKHKIVEQPAVNAATPATGVNKSLSELVKQ